MQDRRPRLNLSRRAPFGAILFWILGGTLLDSHQGLPELTDPARIAANARAFQMLSHEDRLVMVAHLKTPATEGLPASLHRGSVAENPWRVSGRFLPDDLEMGGCADWGWDDRVRPGVYLARLEVPGQPARVVRIARLR